MQTRQLGKSGLQVSVVGLGCNNFGMRIDVEQARKVAHKALDLGITLFDTAEIYGEGKSEEFLGEALGAKRKDVIVATKWGAPRRAGGGPALPETRGGSRDAILRAVEGSLRRLKTDYIDLYQFHYPDAKTPLDETLRALDDLVHQGKVRYIGTSNMVAWQVVEANMIARHHGLNPFIACQDQYNLLDRAVEQSLIPAMEAHGLGLLPYFPLASGALTGKYKRNAPMPEGSRLAVWGYLADRFAGDAQLQVVEKLTDFAETRGHTILELAFSWFLTRPVVSSVIAGATKPEQVELNVAAAGWTLTNEETADIDRISAKG